MSTEQEAKALKIHFFYIVVILIGIIVILATKDWTSLNGFTEYLSVAATITSLVLGVLAIIYSFVSSNSMNGSLGSIEASARDISSIGASLRTVVAGGQTLQDRAEKRNEELHSLIGDLRVAVESVSSKTSEIGATLGTFPTQFGELREEVRKRVQFEPEASKSPEILRDVWTLPNVISFLSNSSLLGFVAIKALADAKQADLYADLSALFATPAEKNDFQYVYGFLIATSSARAFQYEYPPGKSLIRGTARLSYVPEGVAEAIAAEWDKRSARGVTQKFIGRIETSLVSIT